MEFNNNATPTPEWTPNSQSAQDLDDLDEKMERIENRGSFTSSQSMESANSIEIAKRIRNSSMNDSASDKSSVSKVSS